MCNLYGNLKYKIVVAFSLLRTIKMRVASTGKSGRKLVGRLFLMTFSIDDVRTNYTNRTATHGVCLTQTRLFKTISAGHKKVIGDKYTR